MIKITPTWSYGTQYICRAHNVDEKWEFATLSHFACRATELSWIKMRKSPVDARG